MAARTGRVFEAALKTADGTDILQRDAIARGLLECRDDVVLREERVRTLAFGQAECGLLARRRKPCRRLGDRTFGHKLFGEEQRAAIELRKVPRIEHPGLELTLQIFVRQDPVTIDLVFE